MGDLLTTVGFFGLVFSIALLVKALIIKWPVGKYLVSLVVSLIALGLGFVLLVVDDPATDKLILLGTLVFTAAGLLVKYNGEVQQFFKPMLLALGKLWAKLGIKGSTDIVEVKYLGTVTTDSKRGGLKGALLGGFLYGPLGVPIGGLTPIGTKTLCRFAVRYDDGEVKMLDCYKGDARYIKFMSYVRWEDL